MSDKEEKDGPKHEANKSPVSARRAKKLLILSEYLSKQESKNNTKKVSKIYKKSEQERTAEDKLTLSLNQDIVQRIDKNKQKRKLTEQRVLETEESEEVLQGKCVELARMIQQSKKSVIYSGAGISTAASIPDYRGPQGVWTLLQKGEQLVAVDLSDAEPTVTHMCITKLHEFGHVKHVVSQNCDGLHLRAGLPRKSLSEIHGNMYIEICYNCKPHREYIRLFDVTENTGVRRHHTGRLCHKCGGQLKDTIVHFGEKGGLKSPYRWKEAGRAADKTDLMICLGSSLKVLKKYACLWHMDKQKKDRPNLVIVNLQWTPKDDSATLKINGKCDDIMERVMKILGYPVPQYCRERDSIFSLAVPLMDQEQDSTSKNILEIPECLKAELASESRCTPILSDSESDSSDSSDCDEEQDTSDCDTEQDDDIIDNDNDTQQQELNLNQIINKVKEQVKKEKKEKKEVEARLDKKEVYLSKSQQICNEAKFAMQVKNVVTAEGFQGIGGTSKDFINPQMENSKIKKELSPGQTRMVNGKQQEQPVNNQPLSQYDPLRAGPFDPGPSFEHQQKLWHLHMLQIKLQALKEKQQQLKHKEDIEQHKNTQVKNQLEMQNNDQQQMNKAHPEQIQNNQKPQKSVVAKHQTIKEQPKSSQSNKHENKGLKSPNGSAKKLISRDNREKMQQNKSVSQYRESSHQTKYQPEPCYPEMGRLNDEMAKHLLHQQLLHKQQLDKEQYIQEQKLLEERNAKEKMEKQIQQYVKEEQKIKDEKMKTQQQKCEKEKQDMKIQHDNEQLRLHQMFLIQQQMCEQSGVDQAKREENMMLFLQQQQMLVSHQNSQVQDLYMKHQLEFKILSEEIANRQKVVAAKVQAIRAVELEKEKELADKVMAAHIAAQMSPPFGVGVGLGVGNLPWSPPLSPTGVVMIGGHPMIVPMNVNINMAMLSPPASSISSLISASNSGNKSSKSAAKSRSNCGTTSSSKLNSIINRLDARMGIEEQIESNCKEKERDCKKECVRKQSVGGAKSPREIKSPTQSSNKSPISINCQNSLKSPPLKSPTTDFSIAAIMSPKKENDYENPLKLSGNMQQSIASIPGFNELVDKLTTCESCRFIQDYGVAKKRCIQCEELKTKHGQLHGQFLASQKETIVKSEPIHKVDAKIPIKKEIKPDILNTSVNTKSSVEKVNTCMKPVIHKNENANNLSSTSMALKGSPLLDAVDSDSLELSPVIPYANTRVKKTMQDKHVISIAKNLSSGDSFDFKHITNQNGLKNVRDIDNDSSAKRETCASGEEITTDKYLVNDQNIGETEENIDKKEKGFVALKQVRSHSHSEVYDQINSGKDVNIKQEGKYVRSHSHSELLDSDGLAVSLDNDLAETSKDQTKDTDETGEKIGKKRKLSRCISVPGWFGKGLNMKKRRKY